MEKEHQPDSMATITMKPEYPPSEYSASEPPPAYRHHGSTSVQIARIVALTVVASSFILGSFILASSWVSARSSCHQLEQLDAMLDKELALEGRAYGNDGLMADEPLPVGNAHALHAAAPLPNLEAPASSVTSAGSNKVPVAESQHKDDALNQAESKIDEDKLQKIDGSASKVEQSADSDESSESDSSAEEEDELDGVRPMFKLPIQFDLDEIAGAFLANSQKGRMNCVVERRHEEPMERRFPFNILGAFGPRAAGSAERVAIICHGGDEPRAMSFPEPQSQVFAFPLSGPVRLPLRPQPERPAERALPAGESRMPFAPQHRPAPFPLPMPWDSSEEQMGGPREMRIHVQRVIAIPSQHNMPPPAPAQDGNMGPFQPPPLPPQQDQAERQAVMHQFVPQPAPIQELEQPEMQKVSNQGPMSLPWGLTPEDLHSIQRSAEEAAAMHHRNQQMERDNDMQEVPEAFLMAPGKIPNEVKTIVSTLAAAEAQAQAEEEAEEQRRAQAAHAQQLDDAQAPRAPRTMMLPQDPTSDSDGRPHYVQPRSVRSVRSADPMKRMKRYASCTCA